MNEFNVGDYTFVLTVEKDTEALRISEKMDDGTLRWLHEYQTYELERGDYGVEEFLARAVEYFNSAMKKYFDVTYTPKRTIWDDIEDELKHVSFNPDTQQLEYKPE